MSNMGICPPENVQEKIVFGEEPLTTEQHGFLRYLFAEEQKKQMDIFKDKNVRYDASAFRQWSEDGDLSSLPVRLKDKVNRASTLIKNPNMTGLDESLVDTLRDLANYSTMALVFLEMQDRDNQ